MQTDRTDKELIQRCGRMTSLLKVTKFVWKGRSHSHVPKASAVPCVCYWGLSDSSCPKTSFCAKAWSTKAASALILQEWES